MEKNKFKRGPKEKLDKNDKRRIRGLINDLNKASKKVTSSILISELNLNVSKTTAKRNLRCLNFKFGQIQEEFYLIKKYKDKRIHAARSYVAVNINWFEVLFSDEKRFSLQGCDNFYSWSPRNKSVSRSSGLMIWGMILPNCLFSYRIIQGNLNSSKYINLLTNYTMPIANLNIKEEFWFQQDNCPSHRSKETGKFFSENSIKLLSWPSYSPDLNLIENVWSLLSEFVYKDGYPKNFKELAKRIQEGAAYINESKKDYIQPLYNSMPSRICEILEKRGQRIPY